MQSRTLLSSLALSLSLAASLSAQASGPPATSTTGAPATTYYPLYGVTAGIAIPAGRLGDDHAAGYGIGGLVEFAVPNQPYALRAEAMFQRFALKGGRTVGDDVNLFSIGPTIMYQTNQAPTQTFLTGGIAIYNATGEGTRPGFNFGAGLGFPLADFSALSEIRLHVMLAEGKPVLSLPLSIGVKF
jgi:hypothetical protein